MMLSTKKRPLALLNWRVTY